jgi:hypothetical protein
MASPVPQLTPNKLQLPIVEKRVLHVQHVGWGGMGVGYISAVRALRVQAGTNETKRLQSIGRVISGDWKMRGRRRGTRGIG